MADFPNIEPDLEEIALIANNQVYNSPLTGQAQTASLTGAKWQCTPTFSNRNGKEARDLRAFLFDQEGVSGRFNYYPASIDNIGTHAGGGVIDGAGQAGKSLLTKGWDADQPLLFSAGDYLTVNGEMKMVTADVAVDQDYIEYDDTNYMPSPFDPSGWNTDNDASITEITGQNPSGSSVYAEVGQIDTGTAVFSQSPSNSFLSGDVIYMSYIAKQDIYDMDISFYFQEDAGSKRIVVNINSGAIKFSSATWAGALSYTDIGGGWKLIQVSNPLLADVTNCFGNLRLRDGSLGVPPIGAKVFMQAVFFGKANDWPAKLRANATIPITPAIRVSPSDENAIEVENPYFPARLDTDDMSRLQVSAPVIYNTTLSIVEDF